MKSEKQQPNQTAFFGVATRLHSMIIKKFSDQQSSLLNSKLEYKQSFTLPSLQSSPRRPNQFQRQRMSGDQQVSMQPQRAKHSLRARYQPKRLEGYWLV